MQYKAYFWNIKQKDHEFPLNMTKQWMILTDLYERSTVKSGKW